MDRKSIFQSAVAVRVLSDKINELRNSDQLFAESLISRTVTGMGTMHKLTVAGLASLHQLILLTVGEGHEHLFISEDGEASDQKINSLVRIAEDLVSGYEAAQVPSDV